MKKKKKWSKKENEKLLKEYNTKSLAQLEEEFPGRTQSSIAGRYHYIMKKNKKEKTKVDRCPKCGSKNFNQVTTYAFKGTRPANYCKDCFTEFFDTGKVVPPLYMEGLE